MFTVYKVYAEMVKQEVEEEAPVVQKYLKVWERYPLFAGNTGFLLTC